MHLSLPPSNRAATTNTAGGNDTTQRLVDNKKRCSVLSNNQLSMPNAGLFGAPWFFGRNVVKRWRECSQRATWSPDAGLLPAFPGLARPPLPFCRRTRKSVGRFAPVVLRAAFLEPILASYSQSDSLTVLFQIQLDRCPGF